MNAPAAPVLLIEAHEAERQIVARLLQARGWTVVHAADSVSALARAVEVQPALIVLSVRRPGAEGFTLLRALRTDPLLALIPVVALSVYTSRSDQAAAHEAGCRGFIDKPIDPDTFVDTLASFLDVDTTQR